MATTLSGQVTRLSDGKPLANAPVRLIAPASQVGAVSGAQAFGGTAWGWTRQVTGISGNRWQTWERFLKDKVPGLTWEQFCDPALAVNPALQGDRIFKAHEVYLLPEPSPAPTFAWTHQLTGFAGTRWQCWEQQLKGRVAGLRWEQFCDPALVVNPHLQSDRIFKPNQSYRVPETNNQQIYLDTWTNAQGTYQFALGDLPVAVILNASAPGVSGSSALLVEGTTFSNLALGPAAPPAALSAPAGTISQPAPTIAAAAASGSVRSTRSDYATLPGLARRVIDHALFMLGDDAATFDALLPQHQRMCYGYLFIANPGHQHYKDIVCADLVSVSLAAAGVDIAWSAYGGNGRLADYYHPHNGDGKLIEITNPNDYLPGDVFVFGNSDRESRAQHVALYIGPFEGTDRSSHTYPAAKRYEVVEGSLDFMNSKGEQGTAVRGIPLAACLNGEYGTFSWVRRVRLRQIAQAFGR